MLKEFGYNEWVCLQLVCQVKATKKRRTIPVIVRVSDINDNAPVFQGTPYEATVSEVRDLRYLTAAVHSRAVIDDECFVIDGVFAT